MTTSPQPTRHFLLKIFFGALVIRWAYAITLYWTMGDDGLKGVDSLSFAFYAQNFADGLRASSISGAQWFGDSPYSMPLFNLLSAFPYYIFGNDRGALAYVLLQGLIDAGTCLLVYGIALNLSERIARASAAFAAINPTQIVLSGLFYSDTPFVFFVALSFYFAFRFAKNPSWQTAAALGLSLGCAGLIRAIIVPWAFVALAMIPIYFAWNRIPARKFAAIAGGLISLSLCVGVIFAKNYLQYGRIGLTAQGGIHLALWVVPLAREMQDRTPFMTTLTEMQKRTIDRFGPTPQNYFQQSDQYTVIAKEALKDIQTSSLAKSWLSGMTINLVSPAVILSPPVSKLPRPGFYGTPGENFFDKAFNFAFRSGQPVYTWLLIAGAIGLGAMRLLQLIGLAAICRSRANWPAVFLAASWFGYILLVNGPVASPKYRLPLEPLFNVMSGAGFVALANRRKITGAV